MSFTVGATASADRPALRVEDPLARSDWDDLVATHPQATFFHGSAWARTLVESYGFKCRYVAAIQGGRLLGLLPVIEANSWLRGKRGVSLPFTDECAPLVSESVSAEALFKFALDEGQGRGWKYLEVRGGNEHFGEFSQSISYYTHTLPLTPTLEETFAKFDSAVRRAIRKAERSGVSVRFGNDLESVRAYYHLHCRTRTRHGAPPQPFYFFERLCKYVLQRDLGFIALAFHEERPISGAMFFRSRARAIYKYGASDERFQSLRGANLVFWRSIQKLIAAGTAELNFGKTIMSNEGLRKFKLGWGAQERIIHYARYGFYRQAFIEMADLAGGISTAAFSRLPVFLSRWIGRYAYAHLT
jgi:hypothetical protein